MEPPSSAPTSKDMLSFREVRSYNARPRSGETAMYEQQNRPSRVAVMDSPRHKARVPCVCAIFCTTAAMVPPCFCWLISMSWNGDWKRAEETPAMTPERIEMGAVGGLVVVVVVVVVEVDEDRADSADRQAPFMLNWMATTGAIAIAAMVTPRYAYFGLRARERLKRFCCSSVFQKLDGCMRRTSVEPVRAPAIASWKRPMFCCWWRLRGEVGLSGSGTCQRSLIASPM